MNKFNQIGERSFYNENHESPMKKIEEDTKKQEDTPCSSIERINSLKCTYFPNTI